MTLVLASEVGVWRTRRPLCLALRKISIASNAAFVNAAVFNNTLFIHSSITVVAQIS
jgi:hypothetical protein